MTLLALLHLGFVALGAVPRALGLPAFPGAEGFGSDTPGGRGGEVIEVTSLADRGPGTLRAALEARGPRIVVFRTGGLIELRSAISIKNPRITVAGQTAPGAGIAVRGAGIDVQARDVVLRYLRFRPGDGSGADPTSRDGVSVLGGRRNPASDVVIDHCSVSWATDENTSTWWSPKRVTFQWNLIAEGLARSVHPEGIHSMGMLVGERTRGISIHHNVFAHNRGRNPVFQPGVRGELVNNVIYDWGYAGMEIFGGDGLRADVVGNTFIRGEAATAGRRAIVAWDRGRGASRVHLDDNFGPRRLDGTGPEWDIVRFFDGAIADFRAGERPLRASGLTPEPATAAVDRVLMEAGATLPERDPVDQRVIESVLDREGGLIDSPAEVGGYPSYPAGTAAPDSDRDGMPDAWESANGLAPADPADGPRDRDVDGYTNVEEFLNGTSP